MSLESVANLSNDEGLKKGGMGSVGPRVLGRDKIQKRTQRHSSERKIIELIVVNSECEVDST